MGELPVLVLQGGEAGKVRGRDLPPMSNANDGEPDVEIGGELPDLGVGGQGERFGGGHQERSEGSRGRPVGGG